MPPKPPASRLAILILVPAFLLAAAFTAFWAANSPVDEPSYGGHRLSYWVQKYEPARHADAFLPFQLPPESAEAVREIGTNAFPTLLQWMSRPEKGLKGKIVTWASDDSLPHLAGRLLGTVHPKSYRPDLAVLAFRELGPEAEPAVPSLVRMLHAQNNARWATMALCAIGPAGATALIEEFSIIEDGILRANILLQLEHGITPELESYFAPFLGERLAQDSHAAVRMSAATLLGTLTNSASVAVPALTAALSDRDGGVRFTASNSLGQFGGAADSAVVSLQKALKDGNPQVRLDAAGALRSIQGMQGTGDEAPK